MMLYRFPDGQTLEDTAVPEPWDSSIPDFIWDGEFAGGRDALFALGEETSQCVVTLTPGTWMAHETTFSLPPVEFTVTGEIPADAPKPTATVEVTMGEMYFHVTGGEFVAGSNILSITAMGSQPHIMMMMPVPAGTTADEFVDIITGGGEGPPPMMITEPLTLNRTMWTELELESGAYGMACFFPDQHVEMPHVMLGMSAVIEVP